MATRSLQSSYLVFCYYVICFLLFGMVFYVHIPPAQAATGPAADATVHKLVESSKTLTDGTKSKIFQIAVREAGTLGSQMRVNDILAADVNLDGKKEIIVSLHYYTQYMDSMGKVQILFWNGKTYTGHFMTEEFDDALGTKNITIVKLPNHSNPQVVSWWHGGSANYVHVLSQVVEKNGRVTTLWEVKDISRGSVKVEKNLVKVYSGTALVHKYPPVPIQNQNKAGAKNPTPSGKVTPFNENDLKVCGIEIGAGEQQVKDKLFIPA